MREDSNFIRSTSLTKDRFDFLRALVFLLLSDPVALVAGDCRSAVVDVVEVVMVADAEMFGCVVDVMVVFVVLVAGVAGGPVVVGVETSVGDVLLPAASGVSAPLWVKEIRI